MKELRIDIDERRFSLKEAARILNVSRSTLYRERKDRNLRTVRIRGREYVTESHLRDYIASGYDRAAGAHV